MNRTLLSLAAVLGALLPLVFDSALKGAVLLAVAALTALTMWRASAAARHLVWLVAIVALLIVPVLSVALPQWRVLSGWAASPLKKEQPAPVAALAPAQAAPDRPYTPYEPNRPYSPAPAPAEIAPLPPPMPAAAPAPALPPAAHSPLPTSPKDWLPLAWCIGFGVLAVRLLAAHLLLRRASRQCPALTAPPDEKIAAAFADACKRLGITQRVTLLLDKKRTIPVVWGVFRPRLMLPIEARDWSDEQLCSVLLHELGHIKRRDTLVQWLTQVACALHWWNPLVWLAAWRLHAERERACEDLVLASGVRPSAYAEHLLHVATKLSPARWTAACGLAMARKSSLEGRLLAVLSQTLNRRGVTRALTAAALILGTVVAIPLAMLRAADEKDRDGKEYKTDKGSAWVRNENGKPAYIIFAPFKWNLRVSGYYRGDIKEWMESCEVTLPSGEVADLRVENPSPKELTYRKTTYDFANGRVFLLSEAGTVRQLDIAAPPITDRDGVEKLAKLIAAIPPQERADIGQPKHKDARELFESWQRLARANGDIPGALIGELAAAVKQFITYNPKWETVPQLNGILPRLDASRDWTAAETIALLDEIAAVKDSPLDMASWKSRPLRKGEKLPEKFADVAWKGTPGTPNGLRVAWTLERVAAEHRIGEALKARLLVWNPGAVAIVVQVPTWHQGEVKATDAKGAEVQVDGISWTTLPSSQAVRLGPGEFIEINTPGVGLGKDAGRGPWAGPRVGSNVLAKPGDEITLAHSPIPLDGSEGGIRDGVRPVVGAGWWLAHIKTRLARELPLPASVAERTHLLNRAVRDLFTVAPTAEEIAAFTADQTPDALDNLAKRLAARADAVEFAGSLPPAPVKFRVLAADPASDQTPRVVLGPGEYPLGKGATLKMVGRPDGERYIYDTKILFDTRAAHTVEIPTGSEWAIVCRPGDGSIYLLHRATVQKTDFNDPQKVTVTTTELPAGFREEVKRQLDLREMPAAQQAEIFEKLALLAATPAPKSADVQPKNKCARAYFEQWQKYARANGDIPGGLIALLGKSILVDNDPKFPELQRRCDGSRDWPAQEAADLLDAIAGTDNWLNDDLRLSTIEHYDIAESGKPLPPELASLPWGKPDDGTNISKAPTGLRMAFTLEPAANSYAQGAVLPVTVHYHNSGAAPVTFGLGYSSMDLAEARDGDDRKIFNAWTFPNADTGRLRDGPGILKHSVRLEPGHWISVSGARLTIGDGRHADTADSHGVAMMAAPDSTVKLRWSAMTATWRGQRQGEVEWKERVLSCVDRFSPMPKSPADRENLIRRVTRSLIGEEPTAADIAAFVADDAPDSLAKLTSRFQSLPPLPRYAGWLKSGEQTFKVTPGPANYRGTVMTANSSGLYEVADEIFIQHYGMHANFEFTAEKPPHPRTVKLQDKEGRMVPHGIVWRHGSRMVWVAEKERVRRYDLTAPEKLTVTDFPAGLGSIPRDLQTEMLKAFPAMKTAATDGAEKNTSQQPEPSGTTTMGSTQKQSEISAPKFSLGVEIRVTPEPKDEPEQTESPKGAAAPGAATPELRPKPATVDIGKDGSLRLDGQALALGAFKTAAAEQSGRAFVIRADKETPFAKMQEIVEALKNAGVKEVSFAKTQPDTKLTPEGLLGTWRGTVNDTALMLSFHRSPAEKEVRVDV